ncbi:anaphase-promoting complex subunit cdh1-like [Vespula maculifrons]|uniref:Anaphase-promoting complex subunit cdh1-like n=1 Tax=Vespula maculifrons TaxID=7453 RepID=A0ABD2C3B7_VESMC
MTHHPVVGEGLKTAVSIERQRISAVVISRKMAQRFCRKFHTDKDSMKLMRRSLTKRTVRGIKKVKLYDTSMVNNKEDFMNIIGLEMKRQIVENNMERNNNVIVKKKNEEEEEEEEEEENSSGTLRIRKCSVVIVAERCKICDLPFKCKSDVIFHTVMRHGNDPIVSNYYTETNTVTKKQRSNIRRRKTPNNNNLFRLKIKIGEEIISDITMNRKHLKILNSSSGSNSASSSYFPPKIIDPENRKNEDSIKLKNNSKSRLVGIDCFGSTKNHYKDYVMGVQPLNHIHMLDDSLLNEGFQNDDGNRSKHVIDVEDKNTAYCNDESVFFRLPLLCSLSKDIMIKNNENSYITNISSIGERNTFDKENIMAKTQSVKNIVNIDQSVKVTEMHLTSDKEDENKVNDNNDDADDDEIQEILRITKRRRTSNENVIRRLDSPLNKDRMLSDSKEEFINMREKRYHLCISIIDVAF